MFLFKLFGLELDFAPLTEELKDWWEAVLHHLPNIILALIVAVIGYVVASFLKKYFDKLSRRLVRDRTIQLLVSSILTSVLVIIIMMLILSVLNLTGVVNTIVGAAGVIGLALSLAFQDPILNFFSGILLTIKHLFEVGDLIEVEGYMGIVKEINLRHTSIQTLQGQDVMIPNRIVAQNPLKNYNSLRMRRVDLECGVSYGDDLGKVKEVTIKAIKDNVEYDEKRDVQLFFTEFGDSSVNYSVRFWLDQAKTAQPDYLRAKSDAIMAIFNAYNDNDIMIPFPIRTLDFGIKGGEKLNEMLTHADAGRPVGKN
ncbi:mechanosensitive ion channel family protein [Neolewinella antarctica]|uniref:Small conductance mechanosensitive channel n=1 Tax=Neolewinella antarctica TaxID=442734 RepID=A0ABX0X6Q8_9BACT|nr:mechanosensitive ion channel family protein [Neolewinella antarctica]NJC24689.1 small conductance mechanosensitive channel [Neolewinella antarctica]